MRDHPPLPDMSILKDAGERVDDWLTQHGIEASWSIERYGIKLQANYGARKSIRQLSWQELRYASDADHLMRRAENAALAFLSD